MQNTLLKTMKNLISQIRSKITLKKVSVNQAPNAADHDVWWNSEDQLAWIALLRLMRI